MCEWLKMSVGSSGFDVGSGEAEAAVGVAAAHVGRLKSDRFGFPSAMCTSRVFVVFDVRIEWHAPPQSPTTRPKSDESALLLDCGVVTAFLSLTCFEIFDVSLLSLLDFPFPNCDLQALCSLFRIIRV